MGNLVGFSDIIEIKVWHKFSSEPPRGWPMHGCLFFRIKSGYTIQMLLDEINKHRRPQYHITCLLTNEGIEIDSSHIINKSDFYV